MHDKHFDSVGDLMRVKVSARNGGSDPANQQRLETESYGNIRWLGVESNQKVRNATDHGWEKGLRRIRESIKALTPRGVATIRRKKVRRDFGDHLDMQAVYSGNLDRAWETTERRVQRGIGRVVTTVLVNIGAYAHVTSEQMFWRGAAVVALVDALEQSGRRVRVIAFDATNGVYKSGQYNDLTVITIELKAPNAPLDCDKLAVATALAGFDRYYVFRALMSAPAKVRDGLGHPAYYTQAHVENGTLPECLQKLCECEPTILADKIWTKKDAQAFVDSWCDKFNGN